MPWKASDARRHTRKAKGMGALQWAEVANSVLKKTGDEGMAVREANAVVRKRGSRK